MRLLELLFDQDIGVNRSTSTMAPWDFIQPEVAKTSVALFLLKGGSCSERTEPVRLCWSFGAELSPKQRNKLLKCQLLSCSTAASTWRSTCMASLCRVRSVTVTELGDEASSSVTAQNNKAICLNTEDVLGHMGSVYL